MEQRRKILLLLLILCFFSALAILFGIYDLPISQYIVNTASPFGLGMELLGMLVAPYLVASSGMVIFSYCQKQAELKHRPAGMLLGGLLTAGGLAYSGWIYAQASLLICITAVLLTGIAAGALAYYLLPKSAEELWEFFRISVTGVVYMVLVLVVINLFKVFWGRVRFREMEGDFSLFSPWFLPQGINGHRSFPSGHTSNAATLYIVTMFAPFCRKNWKRVLCYLIPILWIMVMAVSRVLVGAHFASDVLFGAGISIALFYIARRFVNRKWMH